MIAAIVTAWGWGVTGPASVASLDSSDRPSYYAASLVMRLFLLLPASLLVVMGCQFLPLDDSLSATLAGLSVAVYGLGATWFFVGIGRPSLLLVCDTLPRVSSIGLGAALLLRGYPLWVFALTQLLGALISVVVSAVVVLRKAGLKARTFLTRPAVRSSLTGQGSGILVGVSSLYLSTPLIIVSALSPAWTPSFALSDRIMKLSLNALLPLQQVLQGWVPSSPSKELRSRVVLSVRIASIIGILAGIAFASLGPYVGKILGANQVALDVRLVIPMGLVVLISTISHCTGTACLVALGRVKAMGFSALLGVIVGLPALFGFTIVWGGPGAAWAIVLAEATVLSYQARVLIIELRGLESPRA